MHVIEADRHIGMVTKWVMVAGQATMYNVTVATDHTYAVGVGQWVVRNADCVRNLNFDEDLGGHTLASHVDVSERDVQNRAMNEGKSITAFNSKEEAAQLVQDTLDNGNSVVQPDGRIRYTSTFSSATGYGYNASVNRFTTSGVRVIVESDGRHIVTAFPTR
jgi:hypothetical protein